MDVNTKCALDLDTINSTYDFDFMIMTNGYFRRPVINIVINNDDINLDVLYSVIKWLSDCNWIVILMSNSCDEFVTHILNTVNQNNVVLFNNNSSDDTIPCIEKYIHVTLEGEILYKSLCEIKKYIFKFL